MSIDDHSLPGFIIGLEETSGGIFVASTVLGEPILGKSQSRKIGKQGVKVTDTEWMQLQSFDVKRTSKRAENRLETVTEHLIDVNYAASEGLASPHDIVNAQGGAIWQDKSGSLKYGIDAGHCVFALTRLGILPFDLNASFRLGGVEGLGLRELFRNPLERTDLIPVLLNRFVEKLIESQGGIEAQLEGVRRILHEQPNGKSVNTLLVQDTVVRSVKPKLLEAVEKSIQRVNKDLSPSVMEELATTDSFSFSKAGRLTREAAYAEPPVSVFIDPVGAKRFPLGTFKTTDAARYIEFRRKVSAFPMLARTVLGDYANAINRSTPRMTLRSEVDRRVTQLAASRKQSRG